MTKSNFKGALWGAFVIFYIPTEQLSVLQVNLIGKPVNTFWSMLLTALRGEVGNRLEMAWCVAVTEHTL